MKPAVTSIWFSPSVSPWRALWLTDYMQSASPGPHFGYVSQAFHTKVVDLEQDEAALLRGLSPTTRNAVHRARREGMAFVETRDLDAFATYFNRFAQQKALGYRVTAAALARSGPDYTIVQALCQGQVLAMHMFLCDALHRRVRYLHGSSLLYDREAGTSTMRNMVSLANRAGHFHEMLLFKSRGYALFDLGGYAWQTSDPELQRINQFKDCFGGRLVCETNHRSLPLHWLSLWMNRGSRRNARKLSLNEGRAA